MTLKEKFMLKMRSSLTKIFACLLLIIVAALPGFTAGTKQNGRIVFTGNQSGTWELYTMEPDGTDVRQITNLPTNNAEGFLPDVSPDGKRIVFCFGTLPIGADAPQTEIFVVNMDGTGLEQLTHDGRFDCAPRWSPDGKLIIFARESPRTHQTVIATVHPDGTHLKTLTTNLWGTFRAAYTPDQTKIVYESQQAGFIDVLRVMDADGSNNKQLTSAPPKAGEPGVSANGEIVYINNLNSPITLPNIIFVRNLSGNVHKQLTHPVGASHDIGPNFSPDGRKIVFASDRLSSDNSLDIFIMDADGSNLTRVLSGITIGGCPSGNCVTPAWGSKP
jgi:tricorn protease-like protein